MQWKIVFYSTLHKWIFNIADVYVVVNTPLRCSGMARILKGSHSFTCTPRVHLLTEWTIPAFAFPAEAATHLLTPEGWKAELALGGWCSVECIIKVILQLNNIT